MAYNHNQLPLVLDWVLLRKSVDLEDLATLLPRPEARWVPASPGPARRLDRLELSCALSSRDSCLLRPEQDCCLARLRRGEGAGPRGAWRWERCREQPSLKLPTSRRSAQSNVFFCPTWVQRHIRHWAIPGVVI